MVTALTRVLTRHDVAALMTPADYLEVVTQGFIALAEGRAFVPAPLHLPLAEGGCHGKGARIELGGRTYAALKFNANLPHNPARFGLPTIQGAILLVDGENGRLLAVIDSIEITLRRTAAATALAAQHLARPSSAVLALIGCGAQAQAQFDALADVLPIAQVHLWDTDAARAVALARQLAEAAAERPARGPAAPHPKLDWVIADSLEQATCTADVIVTCTTSRSAFLGRDAVRPGTFVAAVGADSAHKSEIEPALMAASKVVVDALEQCLEIGDLHHAVHAGVMSPTQVHADLAALASGRALGRSDGAQIYLFDSTGVAVQDVASAVRVYENAERRRAGLCLSFA